jgi:hypothetical protein
MTSNKVRGVLYVERRVFDIGMLSVIMLGFLMLSTIVLSVVILNVIMLSVIMLSVIVLSVIILSVIMLSVIMLSVYRLNVMAPISMFCLHHRHKINRYPMPWLICMSVDYFAAQHNELLNPLILLLKLKALLKLLDSLCLCSKDIK